MSQPHLHLSPSAIYPFDARGVAKRFRHAAIFGALDALHPGETMRFVNDHDPLPLLGQIQQRYGNQVGINYVAREPGNIVIDFTIQLGAQAREQALVLAGTGDGAAACEPGTDQEQADYYAKQADKPVQQIGVAAPQLYNICQTVSDIGHPCDQMRILQLDPRGKAR